jgi:hypothetical protein
MNYRNRISNNNFMVGANCFDELPLDVLDNNELKDLLVKTNNSLMLHLQKAKPTRGLSLDIYNGKTLALEQTIKRINELLTNAGVRVPETLPQPSGGAVSMPQTMGGPTIDTETPVSGGDVVKNPLMDNTMLIYIAILAAAAAYYFYFRKK